MTPLLLVGLVGQLQDSMTVVRGFSFFMSIDHRSGSVLRTEFLKIQDLQGLRQDWGAVISYIYSHIATLVISIAIAAVCITYDLPPRLPLLVIMP